MGIIILVVEYDSYYNNPKETNENDFINLCIASVLFGIVFASKYIMQLFDFIDSGVGLWDIRYWLGFVLYLLIGGFVLRELLGLYWKIFATKKQKKKYTEYEKWLDEEFDKWDEEEREKQKKQRRKDLKKTYKDKESAKKSTKPKKSPVKKKTKPKKKESDDFDTTMEEMLLNDMRKRSKKAGFSEESTEEAMKKKFPDIYKPPKG